MLEFPFGVLNILMVCTVLIYIYILLAKEDGEEYADVMMSLRTMLSFQVLRAAVLCVRGSRRPWSQNTSKLSSDFGLSLFEAGLKG